jgi:hypothetical protein
MIVKSSNTELGDLLMQNEPPFDSSFGILNISLYPGWAKWYVSIGSFFHQPLPHGVYRGLDAVLQVQFLEDISQVDLDRVF